LETINIGYYFTWKLIGYVFGGLLALLLAAVFILLIFFCIGLVKGTLKTLAKIPSKDK
jgi:hypothetical protein